MNILKQGCTVGSSIILLKQNVLIGPQTWFGTGGAAEWYAEPKNVEEWQEALCFARVNALSITLLGEGANVLVSDEGIKGLVIRSAMQQCEVDHATQTMRVGGGLSVQAAIDYALSEGLIGLEEFSGIPGTIGGAVYINLHYFEFLLSHFLLSARVISLKTGVVEEVSLSWFGFGYNVSRLLEKEYGLLDATFQLKAGNPCDVAYALGRRDEIIRHRQRRYPGGRTCGSFFRNFLTHELASVKNESQPVIYVAYYFERLGFKGRLKNKGARVSERHANMLVTLPDAMSHDVVELACAMQREVYEAFGLLPQPECQLLGFEQYPFLKLMT